MKSIILIKYKAFESCYRLKQHQTPDALIMFEHLREGRLDSGDMILSLDLEIFEVLAKAHGYEIKIEEEL